MLKHVLILAASAKNHGLCVAGVDLGHNKLIRLVSNEDKENLKGAIPLRFRNVIHAGDELDVEVLQKETNPFQPENYLMATPRNPNDSIQLRNHYDDDLVIKFMKPYLYTEDFIFGNGRKTLGSSEIRKVKESLAWIKVNNVFIYKKVYPKYKDKPKTRANFEYNGNEYKDISVTDKDFFNLQHEIRIPDAYFLMSHTDTLYSPPEQTAKWYYYKIIAKIFQLSKKPLDDDILPF